MNTRQVFNHVSRVVARHISRLQFTLIRAANRKYEWVIIRGEEESFKQMLLDMKCEMDADLETSPNRRFRLTIKEAEEEDSLEDDDDELD